MDINLLFDEQLNTGECSHALYLGCRDCDNCIVDEYEEQIRKCEEERRKEEERILDAEAIWFEQECIKQEKRDKESFLHGRYEGNLTLHRWNYRIFNDIIEYIIKDKDVRIRYIHYLGRGYVNYGIWVLYKNDKGHYIGRDEFL